VARGSPAVEVTEQAAQAQQVPVDRVLRLSSGEPPANQPVQPTTAAEPLDVVGHEPSGVQARRVDDVVGAERHGIHGVRLPVPSRDAAEVETSCG
jgi:hypothetical protein